MEKITKEAIAELVDEYTDKIPNSAIFKLQLEMLVILAEKTELKKQLDKI